MTLAQPITRYTPAEYYRRERLATEKSEYYRGEIFAMAGGTARHSLVVMNVGGELRQRLKGSPCTAYESNLRLKINATGLRTYPDVSVYCAALEHDPEDPDGETYTNPTVVLEVLSPSTEAFDRGKKADNYRTVESLRAYVLIAQDEPHVEVYERQPNGFWLFHEARGVDATLSIPSIGVDLPLSEIYARVVFEKSEEV